MRKALPIILIAVSLLTILTTHSVRGAGEAPPTSTTPPPTTVAPIPQVALLTFDYPRPLTSFWNELARCETGGNWNDGGHFSGGLGIATSTWVGYGGKQFGSSASKATKEEQIIVAERIAVTGWQTNEFLSTQDKLDNKPFFRPAVGFSGWGALRCAGGTPHLVKYQPDTVVAQKFHRGQKGRLVADLQVIVGAPRTSVYDIKTWAKHQEYITFHNMDSRLVPKPVSLRNPKVNKSKRCVEFEELAKQSGFIESQIPVVSYLMWRESRCKPKAFNGSDPNGGSRGLLQVNGYWTRRLERAGIIKSRDSLFDPATNLRAAFHIWAETTVRLRSSNGWRNWNL